MADHTRNASTLQAHSDDLFQGACRSGYRGKMGHWLMYLKIAYPGQHNVVPLPSIVWQHGRRSCGVRASRSAAMAVLSMLSSMCAGLPSDTLLPRQARVLHSLILGNGTVKSMQAQWCSSSKNIRQLSSNWRPFPKHEALRAPHTLQTSCQYVVCPNVLPSP